MLPIRLFVKWKLSASAFSIKVQKVAIKLRKAKSQHKANLEQKNWLLA
jgi:hypothetical protein